MKWVGKIAIITIILAVIIICSGDEGTTVRVTTPVITSITQTIPANGKVRPISEVIISPDVSGEVISIHCQEGNHVKRGDLLIKIKPDVYQSILDQATAALNAAKAQYQEQEATLKHAELSLKRAESLYNKGAISLSEFEDIQVQYRIAASALNSAEFNIQSANAAVREARENLWRTSIYSPMDGIISRMLVEKGERVVGTSQMAGTEMMRIADFSRMEVVVAINENDIINIEKGDTADIEFDAYRGKNFKGIITQIANSATGGTFSMEQISVFEVKIMVISPAEWLKPGMSASVTIETEKKDSIITIPLQCINPNGCIFVVGKDGNTIEERHITTGIQDINKIEIISGISADEEVVFSPSEAINKTLTDNGKVFIDRD